MHQPLVSIIIPTFNRADLIGETLDSVAAQTYPNWECIIVDDGSTDDTRDVVQAYCKDDPRFVWAPRPGERRSGGSSCRNYGLSFATGEYVIFLDSDDLLMPTCLEGRVQFIEQHPDIAFAAFKAGAFTKVPGDIENAVLRPGDEPDLDRFLHLNHVWQTLCPIWRKEKLEMIGAWDASLLSWQDWELNLRALSRGLRYEKVDVCDCYFRRSASNERTNSLQRHDRKHLFAAIPLFRNVRNELLSSRNLNRERGQALAGLVFLVVMRLVVDHGLRASLLAWRNAFQFKLLTPTDFSIGSAVLASVALPGLRRITWPTLLMMFRKKIGWSRTRVLL